MKEPKVRSYACRFRRFSLFLLNARWISGIVGLWPSRPLFPRKLFLSLTGIASYRDIRFPF